MKKILSVVSICVVSALVFGGAMNLNNSPKEKAEVKTASQDEAPSISADGLSKTDSTGNIIATNALNLSDSESEDVISDLYDDIPEDEIEDYEDMPISELSDDLDNLEDKYEVGEPFSEEDQNELLYAYKTYGDLNNEKQTNVEALGWTWRTYDIFNNVTKQNVNIKYSGSLKVYSPAEGGTYKTNVDITVLKGKSKLKSLKWKTRHAAYGILGTSGKSVSLGIVYDGSVSSGTYSNSFSFDRTETYSGFFAVYTKTWGTLIVKTTSGEFDMNTKLYEHWE